MVVKFLYNHEEIRYLVNILMYDVCHLTLIFNDIKECTLITKAFTYRMEVSGHIQVLKKL